VYSAQSTLLNYNYKCLLTPFQSNRILSILNEMGAQQSSRKITVVSDEASGVIKISDSVVNRLRKEVEGANNNNQQKKDGQPSNTSAPQPSSNDVSVKTEAPIHEEAVPSPPQTPAQDKPEIEKPQSVAPKPIHPASEQKASEPVVQEIRVQRPIIQYVEEPSLSSLRIRAEKEKELNDLDSHWRKRLHEIEQEKATLSNLQAASIAMSVKELEDVLHYKPLAPICSEQRNMITKCLKENPGKPLNCGNYVKEFSNCANAARLSFLERSG